MSSSAGKIAVLGAGLMGHGIAQVASQTGGYTVSILDVEQRFLDSGMKMMRESVGKFVERGKITREQGESALKRVTPTLDLAEAVKGSSLVIEAATEDPKLKLDLYRRMAELVEGDTIIASNTSSISITLLASAAGRPENVCGMHFFNPPQLMPLIEIIKGQKTSDKTLEMVMDAAAAMKKQTVLCKKDSPGFIVNRILVPALNEASLLVYEGIADPEDIDKAITLGLNWPMGPMKLLDYVGLDTTLNISEVFMEEFEDSKYRASPLIRQMVRAGMLGRKSGQGFYKWGNPSDTKSR